MNRKNFDKYELIDGKAIIDNNFIIVTANEALYSFMGILTLYTIIDIVHQVDLDDFIDVANSLRPNIEKSMVIRMKRFDNSYRWMLVKIKRVIFNSENNSTKDYIELHVSDILAVEKLKNQNNELILKSDHIMAIEGNIYFSYDCKTNIISFYSYVDNKIMQMSECPLSAWIKNLIDTKSVGSEAINELHLLYDDFTNRKNEFSYKIKSNYFSFDNEPQDLAIKASTIFENMKPTIIVGSIQNNDNCGIGYSRYTYLHSREHELFSFDEINDYVRENILLNSKCQISLILMEIDDFDEIKQAKGDAFADELYSSVISTTKQIVGYRGVVGAYKVGIVYIAIKNIISDLSTRAFIETLRNQISWNYKLINQTYDITFSLGISRRPYNGTNHEILFKKSLRGLEIAKRKGNNHYVIYLDNVHGEIE